MSIEEKLAILNSMEVVETDGDGETLYYVLVDYNEENLEKLSQVVPNLKEYLSDYGDLDGDKTCIEISAAAWNYTAAEWYTGECFLLEMPNN